MNELTFDQMLDRAAAHTTASSGAELFRMCRNLLARYDEHRERQRLADIISTLLRDSNYYRENPKAKWTKQNIYGYLNKYGI